MKIYASVASSFIILRTDEMYPIYSSYALRFCLVVSVCVRLYSILLASVTLAVDAVVREQPPKMRLLYATAILHNCSFYGFVPPANKFCSQS